MCTEFEEFECEVHTENTQIQSVSDVIDIVEDDDIDDIEEEHKQERNESYTFEEMKTMVRKTENLDFLKCLLSNARINDTAIFNFVSIFNKSQHSCIMLESLVTEHLLKNGHNGISEKYKNLDTRYKKVFFVKHLKKEKHWVLIEWKQKSLNLFDNFPWPHPEPMKEKYNQILKQLSQKLLQGISTDEFDLKVKMSIDLPKETVQQIDDNNCALHVLMNSLCLTSQSGKIFYKDCHVQQARKQMLKTIIERKLTGFFLQLMVECLIYFTFIYTFFLQDVETEQQHVHSTQESLVDYFVTVRKPEDVNGVIDTHSVQSSEESVDPFSLDNDVNGVIDTHSVQSSEEIVDPFSLDNAALQMVNFILFVLHKFQTFIFEGCCFARYKIFEQ